MAEEIIRRAKPEGWHSVEQILTTVTSLRQQGRDMLECMTGVCSGQTQTLLPGLS
jgi:hypothetical protein